MPQEISLFDLLGSAVTSTSVRGWIYQAGNMWVQKQVEDCGIINADDILAHLEAMKKSASDKWMFTAATNHEAKAIQREIDNRKRVRDCPSAEIVAWVWGMGMGMGHCHGQ